MMRVTVGSASQGSLAGQLSSGRKLTKPSDSPSGTTAALQLGGELKRMTQYQGNASDALGWLTTVASTLSGADTEVQKVRTLVLRGMNTGSADPDSTQALAQQVDQARACLLSLANASYLGRPVFGGTTAGSLAFDSSGTYVGDTGVVSRTVGPDTSIDLNTPGTATFGPDGNNLFDLLSTISQDLKTNPSALGDDLAKLDAAQTALSSSQSLAAAKYQRIQTVLTTAGTNSIQLQSKLADLQDIDLANMAIQVTTADAAYQAALATTAKIQQNSLLDFLR